MQGPQRPIKHWQPQTWGKQSVLTDRIFLTFLWLSPIFGKSPDIFLTTAKFPDSSTSVREVVTLLYDI